MILPRYRTLDGDELELPLAMDHWVLVPRALARFDPELAWALDYEDAPAPDDADPRLDFSAGALLVSVERWNEHADLEPNLAPCRSRLAVPSQPNPVTPCYDAGRHPVDRRFAAVSAHSTLLPLAALASAYVLAVGAWLWTLRDGIRGPDVSTGLLLVGTAVLLAWLAGVTGHGWRSDSQAQSATRTWPELRGAVLHFTEDPLGILRAGMALQLIGFAVLVLVRVS